MKKVASLFWQARGNLIPLSEKPLFMGIVNLTPDSFSERPLFAKNGADKEAESSTSRVASDCARLSGQEYVGIVPEQGVNLRGEFPDSSVHSRVSQNESETLRQEDFEVDSDSVVEYALDLVRRGAAIIDLGAESTSPGSKPVSPEEQIRRLLPSVKRLVRLTDCPLSIDTTSSQVARQALEAGAKIINDISGGTFDPEMIEVVRHYEAGVCLGHIQGIPGTMQLAPSYTDVVDEVHEFLAGRRDAFMKQGVSPQAIALDPGIGFGKTLEHNFEILRHADKFRIGDSVLLVGHSRKRFLRSLCGPSPSIEQLDAMTAIVSAFLARKGVDVLRVHRIEPNRAAIALDLELLL